MELEIFDYISYYNDKEAQDINSSLSSELNNKDGYWVYDEPDFPTKYNIRSTFTIFSSKVGVVFIKVFPNTISKEDVNKSFWKIDDKDIVSPIIQFRDFVHTVESKITEPSNELNDDVKITTIYYIPNIDNLNIGSLGLKKK